MSKKRDIRPVFYMGDDEYKSAGMLFYAKEGHKIRFLLINSKNQYEDCGGKSEVGDVSLLAIAKRETYEELNGIVPDRYIIRDAIYIPLCKYVLYIAEVDPYWARDTGIFGGVEHHQGNNRTVEWIDYENLTGLPLNPRLKKINFRLLRNQIIYKWI